MLLPLMPGPVPAHASSGFSIPTVTIACPGCNSFNALWTRAESYFAEWKHRTPPGFPAGTHVRPNWEFITDWNSGELVFVGSWVPTSALVVSDTFPLSVTVRFSEVRDGMARGAPIDAYDNMSARDLDNRIFARSAKLDPFNLPTGLTPQDGPEGISQALQQIVQPTGRSGLNFWHGLLNFPQLLGLEYLVNQPGHPNHGQRIVIYVGDTVIVKYANGWTEKWKLQNAASHIAWSRVEGSLRDENGNVPQQPQVGWSPAAGEPARPSFSWSDHGQWVRWQLIPVSFTSHHIPGGVVAIRQISTGSGGGAHIFGIHLSS